MDIPQNPPERTRDSYGRFAREPNTAERDACAAQLRKEGKTYKEIARALGYYDEGGAWRAVMRVRTEVRQEAAEGLIAVEKEELDRLYQAACDLIESDHHAVAQGKAVYADDGTPIYDAQPKLAAINAAVKIRESYRKLLGLDQPAKQEISGGVKYEVVGIEAGDLS